MSKFRLFNEAARVELAEFEDGCEVDTSDQSSIGPETGCPPRQTRSHRRGERDPRNGRIS